MVYRVCSVLIALACRFTVHCWFMLYRDRRPQVIFRRWPWAETHRCEMVTKAKRGNKHPTSFVLFALMLWLCQLTALLGLDHNSRTTSATKVDTILSPMQEAWQMRLLNDGLHSRHLWKLNISKEVLCSFGCRFVLVMSWSCLLTAAKILLRYWDTCNYVSTYFHPLSYVPMLCLFLSVWQLIHQRCHRLCLYKGYGPGANTYYGSFIVWELSD